MKQFVAAALLPAIALAATAQAADDPGLRLAPPATGVHRSMAVEARISIALGGKPRHAGKRIVLGIAAGPSLVAARAGSATGVERRVAGLVRMEFKPGRTVAFSLAGQPLLAQKAAAHAHADEQEQKDGKGPSTLGWVAIGVGAVLVLGAGAVYIAAINVEEE